MKQIKLMTIAAAALLSAGGAWAQTTVTTTEVHVWNDPQQWWGNHWVYATDNRYTASELSFDMFGSYLAGEQKVENIFKTNIRHGFWGGGVGLNYFFTRNLGIGGNLNIPDDGGGNFIDSFGGDVIARFPIDPSGLAPYIFGGGGRQTDPEWQFYGDAGVGLEYRFNPVTGIFSDARYVWADKTSDGLLIRAGLRFVF